MKNFAHNLIAHNSIAVLKATFLKSRNFILEHRLATKTLSLILLTALLMPMLFFGDFNKTSAQVQTSSLKANLPAPVSAPPQGFLMPSSDAVSSNALGLASGFNASIINSYGAIASVVTAPTLPEGFETAQPVSPLFASVSSSFSSVGSALSAFFGFSTTTANPTSTNLLTTQTAGNNAEYDFDGDGKSDVARWKASSLEWQIKNSNGGSLTTNTLGTSGAVLAPGDFDGDLKTDLAVFNNGAWTIKPSGGAPYTNSFGTAGDLPATGDYNGDGRSDYAIYRPSTSTFWIQLSSDFSYTSTAFGAAGDIHVPGDYDGDNKTDPALFRPSTGDWYVKNSSTGVTTVFHWGIATDIPVPADYDGDGKTDLSVYRPSSGTWFIYKSNGGGSYIQQIWGNYGDQPVPADYDGDGRADLSVWRPKTGVWFTSKSCNFDNTCGTNPQYIYESLGINGDVPVEAAYLKKIGGIVPTYNLAKLRLSPKNATGGTDLYSRNFSWGTGLVGLPGRAGLDAGFGISYNSLVWLKDSAANKIIFDPDQSNVTPGFKMGFPTIEPIYYDKNTTKFSYLMITPSGARVEFQQTAASDTYETVDSSYVQLKTQGATNPNDPVDNITIMVTGTDGTKMSYEWKAGAYRCKEIKDRNGNFISIVHDQYGLLRTVTDTLGRVITVNYDTEFYPTSITQDWKDSNGSGSTATHTWATFAYTTLSMNPSFDSTLGVFGPTGGTVIKVLDKVIYGSSGSSNNTGETRFEYNDFGQVKKVRTMAADGHELGYVITNLNTPGTNLTDVPRLSQTKSWTENFNGGAEVVVNNSITENQTIPEAGGTGTKIEVSMVGHPNGAVSKTFVGSSGWMEGLPIVTEDWADNGSGVARQRWTQSMWTQDDPNLSYIQNPRVIESKVGDTTNTKRTTVEYVPVSTNSPIALYGLVSKVKTFAADQSTVWRESTTEYNLDNAYVSRRIIGLPAKTEVSGFDQAAYLLKLVSKVTYNYDEGVLNDSNFEQNITSVIKHDNTNYSSSFITGRGNPTSTKRWNVDYPTSSSEAVSSSVKYNIAGAVVAQSDPQNRTVKFSYADKFNDTTTSRNTYAYPTKLTDAAGNYSEVKYRFDIGTNVWAKSPAPAGNTNGKESTREYDSLGRLLKDKVVNLGGAYTRYEYPTNGIQSRVWSTVIDTNNNGADSSDEVYSESWTDGTGRTLKSRSELPGSVGGWKGTLTEYNILGQVKRSTVPTEISVNNTTNEWTLTGDDIGGWLWNSLEYDWKGRVSRTINTDGSDKLISYDGCGCAGGQITTIQSELVPRDDQPTVNSRRTQKAYADILGRTFKTEIMNWDGSTVYSSTLQTFNGRDQVILERQYAGMTSSGAYQDTTATFDGHGRLKTSHRPEQQNSDQTPAYTTYNYNMDDSIQSMVDARGATTYYTYDDPLGLLTQISYTVPNNSNIAVPATINFDHDSLGNRIWMTDGLGRVDYEYDALSRITAETRQFNDELPKAPLPGNRFKLQYSYELSGQLKSITDPFGVSVNYAFDKIGAVRNVTGSSFGGFTDYATNIQYRAWGATKHEEYGNGKNIDLTFNSRLQPELYELKSGSQGSSQLLNQRNYQYDADGKIHAVGAGGSFSGAPTNSDRFYKYDHTGFMTASRTGVEAHGQTENNLDNLMYRFDYTHDAFGNPTSDGGTIWTETIGVPQSQSRMFVNNRNPNNYYDADGRITYDGSSIEKSFNAAGAIATTSEGSDLQGISSTRVNSLTNDGGSNRGKINAHTDTYYYEQGHNPRRSIEDEDLYLITSTVLGGATISEVKKSKKVFTNGGETGTAYNNPRASHERTFIRLNGAVIGWQRIECQTQPQSTDCINESQSVVWEHQDPGETSYRNTYGDTYSNDYLSNFAEFDPLGRDTYERPQPPPAEPDTSAPGYPWILSGLDNECHLEGLPESCELVNGLVQNGSAIPENLARYQRWEGFSFRSEGFGIFTTTIPDVYTNNSGSRWTTAPGVGHQEGWRIFEGGTFVNSWTALLAIQTRNQGKSLDGAIFDAVKTCAKDKFGVEISSFSIADTVNRINGKVVVNSIAQTEGIYARPSTYITTVTTNVQYSRVKFNQLTGLELAEGTAGVTINKVTPNGQRPNPSVNYRFNDEFPDGSKLAKGVHELSRFLGATDLAIQIHELGNSLSSLTGISYRDESRADPDSGEDYENCVRDELRKKKKN